MNCKYCYGIGYDASGHPCACTMSSSIAKVGQRLPGPEPLNESPWRRHLRHLAYWMLMAILGLLLLSGIVMAAAYA